MTEETVVNTLPGVKSVTLYCNWCSESWAYTEAEDDCHEFTSCPWCRERKKIPRERLRRINGGGPREIR